MGKRNGRRTPVKKSEILDFIIMLQQQYGRDVKQREITAALKKTRGPSLSTMYDHYGTLPNINEKAREAKNKEKDLSTTN